MNARERTLAVLLIVGIVVVVGGFAGYQFIVSPLTAKGKEAEQLEAETKELDAKAKKFQKDAKRLAETKKRSLPADIEVAKFAYFAALDKILVNAKVAPGFSINPRSPDNRSVPILSGKNTVYTKIAFEVQFKKADLWQVYDVLTAYYKLNVLHQITALNIKRDDETSAAARRTGGRNDLTVTFTTEAIILDGAENRRTLLPVPPAFAAVGGFAGYAAVNQTTEMSHGIIPTQYVPVVATKPRDYTLLVLKDIFHGPYPKPASLGVDRISDVTAKVGEAIAPVKVGVTFDDVIDEKVTLAVKSDSPLFPPGSIKIDGGNLKLTPASEEQGTAKITVTATNAKGKTATRDFRVSISVPVAEVKQDISQTIILISVTPRSDGTTAAKIRDNANKLMYEIEATARGAKVEKFWYIGNVKKRDLDYEDRNLLIISDDWSATKRKFRVVSVDYDGLILAEDGAPAKAAAPAPRPGGKFDPRAVARPEPKKPAVVNPALAAVVGVAATNAPQGPPQLYRWTAGKTLKGLTPIPAAEAQKILMKAAEGGPVVAVADEE